MNNDELLKNTGKVVAGGLAMIAAAIGADIGKGLVVDGYKGVFKAMYLTKKALIKK